MGVSGEGLKLPRPRFTCILGLVPLFTDAVYSMAPENSSLLIEMWAEPKLNPPQKKWAT
jgi:hypothetical protein